MANVDANESTTAATAQSIVPLYKRVVLFLEDRNFEQAREYCERILDIDPEYAPAYIGKLCAELEATSEADLVNKTLTPDNKEVSLDNMPDYKKALRFADANYRLKLEGYNRDISERVGVMNEHIAESIRIERERFQKEIERLQTKRERIAKFQGCISAGGGFTVGLKADGTVVAVGNKEWGGCKVSGWRDIIAVSTGGLRTLGLKADGTVVSTDKDVNISGWRDIISISCGFFGIKTDGSVVNIENDSVVGKSEKIVQIEQGNNHIVILRADGMIHALFSKDAEKGNKYGECNIEAWRNTVAISVGNSHTVGLNAAGLVGAVGLNEDGQCNVSKWQDIIAISAGGRHTVGLKADGTVIATGGNNVGQCNVSSWHDIVAISAHGWFTVGLKADGTVVAVGNNEYGQCNVSKWRDIGPVSKEQILKGAQRRAQGLCENCGGQMSGFLLKKCQSCGK